NPADAINKANEDQLTFFPKHYLKGLVKECDHSVMILADHDLHEMEGVDPQRIMKRSAAYKPYREWRQTKEAKGQFTWTLALYGTPAMAAEADMDLKEYWDQIINACYLDDADP